MIIGRRPKFPMRPVVANPHTTNEAVMYTLDIPFHWVSVFPRYFHTHSEEEVRKKNKEMWITNSIEEAVAYLNVDEFLLKTTENVEKKIITRGEWPEGVQVLNRQCDIHELDKAHESLQNLFSKVIDGESEICQDFFSLCPDSRHNAFLFWSNKGDISYQICMQRLKNFDDDLFRVIMKHAIIYLKDLGVDIPMQETDWSNPDSNSDFYNFMNRNCTLELLYYFPLRGSLISHVDHCLPLRLPGNEKDRLRRQGPIYTLNFKKKTKYFDLFPVWQPHNTSGDSTESAYRLETHFGQTTKLSGFHGRYRFSHAIPSGSEGEGFTASWKWEEFNQKNIDELDQLIFVHDNKNEVEYTGGRNKWRRDGATALKDIQKKRTKMHRCRLNENLSVSSNLQSMLDRLKNLSAHEAESSLNCLEKEDTPVVALKRKEIVQNLQQTLQNLTRKCSNIQSEPHNALTRLLFSGITASGDARTDPLLPCIQFLDKSIMGELTKKIDGKSEYTEEEAKQVCSQLCVKSQEGIGKLQALRNLYTQNDSVTCDHANDFQFKLCTDLTDSDSLYISKFHYGHLQQMYAKHSDDSDNTHFLRRLFCLLMRYKTLGGPMYQCSCTSNAFANMNALPPPSTTTPRSIGLPFPTRMVSLEVKVASLRILIFWKRKVDLSMSIHPLSRRSCSSCNKR
jgi:hypothetical protein